MLIRKKMFFLISILFKNVNYVFDMSFSHILKILEKILFTRLISQDSLHSVVRRCSMHQSALKSPLKNFPYFVDIIEEF